MEWWGRQLGSLDEWAVVGKGWVVKKTRESRQEKGVDLWARRERVGDFGGVGEQGFWSLRESTRGSLLSSRLRVRGLWGMRSVRTISRLRGLGKVESSGRRFKDPH